MPISTELKSLEGLADAASRDVLTCPHGRVTKEALDALFSHECSAIIVPEFFPRRAAAKLGRLMLQSELRSNWKISQSVGGSLEESQVDSVGMPHNVALASGNMEGYFAQAGELNAWMRTLNLGDGDQPGVPSLTPIDKLRIDLDDVWSGGCMVSRQSGRSLLPAAGRIMEANRDDSGHQDGFCHVDELELMVPERGLFSANIYLNVPPPMQGGELLIYPLRFSTKEEFCDNAASLSLLLTQEKGAQQELRRLLPMPLRISPRAGDLVLLCAQRPHSVSSVRSGTRVSIQSFLTHSGAQEPLRLDA